MFQLETLFSTIVQTWRKERKFYRLDDFAWSLGYMGS